MTSKTEIGNKAEQLAVDFLKAKGYRVVERNFRSRWAEIDIIAFDKDTLCFIEVKGRKSSAFGSPAEAVSLQKQRKIVLLAQSYLSRKGLDNQKVRFDVVSVVLSSEGQDHIMELIPNAFEFCS